MRAMTMKVINGKLRTARLSGSAEINTDRVRMPPKIVIGLKECNLISGLSKTVGEGHT